MKELSYFRFHPDEWLTGDITLENFETQGVFINLCAYLWKKDNSVPIARLKQRYGRVKNSIWDTLFNKNILKKDDKDNVYIEFLAQQFEAIKNNSKVLSDFGIIGAKKRWGGHRVAIASDSLLDKDKDKDKDKEEENIKETDVLTVKKTKNPFQVPDYLKESILSFVEMRKKIRKPTTDRAIELIIKDVQNWYPDNERFQIMAIEKAVKSSWQGVFELKPEEKKITSDGKYTSGWKPS